MAAVKGYFYRMCDDTPGWHFYTPVDDIKDWEDCVAMLESVEKIWNAEKHGKVAKPGLYTGRVLCYKLFCQKHGLSENDDMAAKCGCNPKSSAASKTIEKQWFSSFSSAAAAKK